jgi:hypothetical protein
MSSARGWHAPPALHGTLPLDSQFLFSCCVVISTPAASFSLLFCFPEASSPCTSRLFCYIDFLLRSFSAVSWTSISCGVVFCGVVFSFPVVFLLSRFPAALFFPAASTSGSVVFLLRRHAGEADRAGSREEANKGCLVIMLDQRLACCLRCRLRSTYGLRRVRKLRRLALLRGRRPCAQTWACLCRARGKGSRRCCLLACMPDANDGTSCHRSRRARSAMTLAALAARACLRSTSSTLPPSDRSATS